MALSDNLDSSLLQIMDLNDYGNYYTDLELAAAIGKNLLERNKELEHLLNSTQVYVEEQVEKSEFLSRQLDDAHKTNESRVKLMEQIENNSEELSRNNTKLKRETRSIQEHNQILTESLQSLVEKCDNFKLEMDDLKQANARLQHQLSQSPTQPKVITVPQPNDHEKDLVKAEVERLSVAIKYLKVEQNQEKLTRQELESELSELITQNQDLEVKLRLFARNSRDSYIEVNEDSCVNVGELEEDEGSYMEEAFVLVESQDVQEIESDLSPEKCDISFLDELDQQYHDLVLKYNSLLDKCKSEGIPYESRQLHMVQRGVQTTSTETTVLENKGQIPEYKKMFAKIYEKLREGTENIE